MRSHKINVDRLVNQLVPHYLGGRRLILFLQSCLKPLQTANDRWVEWVQEKKVEASLTSQVILMEYYLNKKFKKYFKDQDKCIIISDGTVPGVPIYFQSAGENISKFVLYNENENGKKQPFQWQNEKSSSNDVSFVVFCPYVNTNVITEKELSGMISYVIDKYKVAGKSYRIEFN